MIPATELVDHPGNWRDHSVFQTYALRNLLDGVGVAGALLAYRSPRQGGKYVLLNGHLRRSLAAQDWPVLVLDLTDEEGDLLLLSHDVIPGMATFDHERLNSLIADVAGSVEDGVRQALRAVLTQMGVPEDSRITANSSPIDGKTDWGVSEEKDKVRHALRCPHCFALLYMTGGKEKKLVPGDDPVAEPVAEGGA